MPQTLNATKGHVFTNWIAARRSGGDARETLGALLTRGFRRSAAAARHEIDGGDAEVLSDGVVVALRRATGVYEERLTGAGRGCFEGLAETLGGLLEELDG